MIKLGGTSISCNGDMLTLEYNATTHTVAFYVSQNNDVVFVETVDDNAHRIVSVLRNVLKNDAYNFKRNGKLTKCFRWNTGSDQLNVSACKFALESVTSLTSVV